MKNNFGILGVSLNYACFENGLWILYLLSFEMEGLFSVEFLIEVLEFAL